MTITQEQFERGLRLDQYISTITQNKENFRANFIKAIEIFTPDDLRFLRGLPYKVNIAVPTDDGNLDSLRDVPIISRLSVEVGKLTLRLFRPTTHVESAHELQSCLIDVKLDYGIRSIPAIVFMRPDMSIIGACAGSLDELQAEMKQRQITWAISHPEIKDATEPLVNMSPITRTRAIQAIYAATPEQRIDWGRKTIAAWKQILGRTKESA